jgi:RNA polymerase sigma-70 factor (ECF subfamily)
MAAGDERAVEVFYRRYFDWLYAQARRASRRDEAFCLDVVQDAVLRVLRTVRKVESEPQLRSWLTLVVQTTAYDRLRAEGRRKLRETTVAAATAEAAPIVDDNAWQAEWLKQRIARMDPQLARILALRLEERWSLRRIADSLGLPIGTVDGRLRRALRQLRRQAIEDFDVAGE